MLAYASLSYSSTGQVFLNRGVIDFDINQNHFFDALVQMPKDSVKNESPKEALKRALALTHFGLGNAANALYKRIAKINTEQGEEARFYLGKIAYYKKQWPKALQYFEQAGAKLPLSIRNQLKFYQASAYLKLKQPQKAANILDSMRKGLWVAYGYYNLGVYYAKSDSDSTRAIIALRVSDALNQGKNSQSLNLKNQAIFSAGYLALQANDQDKALSFLNRVRVASSVAPKALYIKGLALSDMENYRSSIQAWHQAKQYPLVKSGVAETFLAMPYAYDKLGYVGKAASSYLSAISAFDKEGITIGKIIDTIKKEGARKALLEKSSLDDIEWFLSNSIATNTPKVAYLIFLMKSPDIYDDVEQLKEAELLQKNLKLWKKTLGVLRDVLKNRVNIGYAAVDYAQKNNTPNNLNKLDNKLKAIVKALNAVKNKDNFVKSHLGNVIKNFNKIRSIKDQINLLRERGFDVSKVNVRVEQIEAMAVFEILSQFDGHAGLSKKLKINTHGIKKASSDLNHPWTAYLGRLHQTEYPCVG